MKLIVGLGNPGEKYKNNRHNVGYLVIDKLSQIVKGQGLMVKKTNAFMNDSGSTVKKFLDHYSLDISHLYVVHDDLDLPLGTWKMQFAKGPKDNGGINSIEQVLGTKDFWRIRVGIDSRGESTFAKATAGKDYVLEDFIENEKIILDKAIDDVCKKLATF